MSRIFVKVQLPCAVTINSSLLIKIWISDEHGGKVTTDTFKRLTINYYNELTNTIWPEVCRHMTIPPKLLPQSTLALFGKLSTLELSGKFLHVVALQFSFHWKYVPKHVSALQCPYTHIKHHEDIVCHGWSGRTRKSLPQSH